MYNRRYEKVFLMLRQEVAGYALSKRPPWGSCIMELKNGRGRLQLTVQGLKPLGRGYTMYVMAGEESIFCGEVHPDSREGAGELKWDFQPDALGKGKKAEDLHTILLLAEDGKGGYSVPLTAYFGEKTAWKKTFQPRKLTEEKAEKKIEKKKAEEKKPTEEMQLQAAEAAAVALPVCGKQEEATQQTASAAIAEQQKNSYHGSFQGLLAKFRQELENIEETGILTKQETEAIRNMGADTAPIPSENTKETEGLAEKEADTLFSGNRELEPFGDGRKWKCLSLEELTLLSQVPLKWQREFFFLLPYRRYHHLILQEREDGFWLGLPALYQERDAADARAFGFPEFRRVDGDWGYWMTFLKREG